MSQKLTGLIVLTVCAHAISVMGSECGNYTTQCYELHYEMKDSIYRGALFLCFSVSVLKKGMFPPFIQFFLKKCFLCLQERQKIKIRTRKSVGKLFMLCVLNFKLNVLRHRIGIEPLLKTLFQDGKFSVKSQRKQNQFSRERFMTVSNSFR